MQLLPEYSAKTQAIMAKGGGKLVSVFMVNETLIGNNIPQTMAIIEFTDAESIKKAIESEEYKEGIPTREKCFTELNYFIGTEQ